jgi:Ca2+-binding EF-hand superfamily protein
MKYLSHSLLMGALITITGIAFAQPPVPFGRGPLPFITFDLNGDGAISQQEFDTILAQRKLAPNPQGYSARRINDPPSFTKFDLNGDGTLSPQELLQGQNRRRAQRQQGMSDDGGRSGTSPGPGMGPDMGPGMGRGMGPGGGAAMGPGRGRHMPSFSDFDLNADGLLHQQEFEQARAQRIRERLEQGYQMRNLQNAPTFNAIDTDQDGAVSAQEFAAAQAKHRQR